MIRAIVAMLAIVVLATGAPEAHGAHHGGGHFKGQPAHADGAHERFEHFRHFHGPVFVEPYLFPAPLYAPPPVCAWQDGHWIDQRYVDRYGGTTHVPEWIPGHWLCG